MYLKWIWSIRVTDERKSWTPVKVLDHAFQLLKFFHTKFVLLQQPDCACSDISTFAFRNIHKTCQYSTTISYLAGNLLLNMALWYFSSPEKKPLGQKISWRFSTWSKKSLKDRPGTQSLQWPVSPPWSWSSWRGRSLPTHRHTCRLKMKYFQMYDKEWHGTAFTILVMFFLSQKCKRKMTQRRKEREGLTCVFCMFRVQAFHSVLVHIMV